MCIFVSVSTSVSILKGTAFEMDVFRTSVVLSHGPKEMQRSSYKVAVVTARLNGVSQLILPPHHGGVGENG